MVLWVLSPVCISVNCSAIHPGLSWDSCGVGLNTFKLVSLLIKGVHSPP